MAEANETAPAPQPGTPEYDAAMAAHFRSLSGRADPPAKPDYLPAKFWDEKAGAANLEALAKSYTELESARSKPAEPPPVKPDGLKIPDPQQAVENAGIDWAKVTAAIEETGTLDDAAMAAIEKSGVPKEIIQGYLQMYASQREAQTQAAMQHVGGEAKMAELLQWAGQNLSAAEIADYNKMLGSASWKTALDVLSTKHAASSKTAGEPRLETPGGGGPGAAVGYRSRAEMLEDMGSPKYDKDPAFRAQVAQKMAQATWEYDRRGI